MAVSTTTEDDRPTVWGNWARVWTNEVEGDQTTVSRAYTSVLKFGVALMIQLRVAFSKTNAQNSFNMSLGLSHIILSEDFKCLLIMVVETMACTQKNVTLFLTTFQVVKLDFHFALLSRKCFFQIFVGCDWKNQPQRLKVDHCFAKALGIRWWRWFAPHPRARCLQKLSFSSRFVLEKCRHSWRITEKQVEKSR